MLFNAYLSAGRAALALVVLSLISASVAVRADDEKPAPTPFVSSQLLLVNGAAVGILQNLEGGQTTGKVTTFTSGAGGNWFLNKMIAERSMEPLVFETGLGMGKQYFEWLADTIQGRTPFERELTIWTCTPQQKALRSRSWREAFLRAVRFPAMDATSHELARVGVAISARDYSVKTGGADCPAAPPIRDPRWAASNYRFELDGINTRGVSKIGSFQVEIDGLPTSHDGFIPGRASISDLKIEVASKDAGDFEKWYQSAVIQGASDGASERTGTLVGLSQDLSKELFRLELGGVGIYSLSYDDGTADRIGRVRVSFYVESVNLKVTQ